MPKGYPGSGPGCSHEGCDKPHMGRGLCANHYKQWQYRQNPEKYRRWSRVQRQRDGERLRAADRIRYVKDKDRYRTARVNRKARERHAEGSHTHAEWLQLLERFHGHCVYCGAGGISRDHLIPLSKGGTNDIGNIVPACLTCNLRKNDAMPFVFVQRMLVERGLTSEHPIRL